MTGRLISALLLLLILFSLTGYYPVFKAEQWLIRKEIKKKIKNNVPPDELHRIYFTNEALELINWTRRDKEFRHNGNMYDVVHTDTLQEGIAFFCVNDQEEKILFEKLDDLVAQEMLSGKMPVKQKAVSLIKLLSAFHYLPVKTLQLSKPASSQISYAASALKLLSGYRDTVAHPPETRDSSFFI